MSRKTIDSYIANVIEESLKATLQRRALREKELQNAASSEEPKEKDVEKKDAGEETEKLKKGNVTVDDVIEKLNSIRSGKSFNDEDISEALKKYFEELGVEEKTALLAFLKGISQIVTGEISADTAIDPEAADIEMKKTTGPEKVSIKPNVIKAPDIEKNKKPSSEDTTGPLPISAKKK